MQMDAQSLWLGAAATGAFLNSGFVRVLSPQGKTLGFAAYTQDEKGNRALREITPPDFGGQGLRFGE